MKDAILNALSSDYPWADRFHYFNTVDSTNNYLKRQALLGAPHGTVAVADCQTGGKGRLGRSFQSPGGVGIYLSMLLRPDCPQEQLMHLTCAVGTAMCDALEEAAGVRPGIKWTNDLVCEKRKLSGILVELLNDTQGKLCVIIGIGVNCCQQLTDFPEELRDRAGSLAMVTGRRIDRPKVAAAMMEALANMDRNLLTGKEAMLEQYRRDCVTLGQKISVVRGDEIRHGTALDIGNDGDLIVRFDDGHTEAVSSGEVSIRGMYGYV
mgnify:FL=1